MEHWLKHGLTEIRLMCCGSKFWNKIRIFLCIL